MQRTTQIPHFQTKERCQQVCNAYTADLTGQPKVRHGSCTHRHNTTSAQRREEPEDYEGSKVVGRNGDSVADDKYNDVDFVDDEATIEVRYGGGDARAEDESHRVECYRKESNVPTGLSELLHDTGKACDKR
ncbi:hypothetical protein HG531_009152 [Fusarium graminearum]|nr:hypothetical protein HG531_009152 [Fusarium graminearum]